MLFTLNLEAGEPDHDFVLRVEQQRRSLCLPADKFYHTFVYKLHLQLKGELDQVCCSRKANRQGFAWGEVVKICKDHALGTSLIKAVGSKAGGVTQAPQTPVEAVVGYS